MDFRDLGISSVLVSSLERHGIVKPTTVQKKTIPLILKGRDVLIQSETGSGKTIGFAVPTIEMIKPAKTVQVLVIAPTRELAKQVGEEYIKFKKKGLEIAIVYGGVSINRQEQRVKVADVVVGTPGRLLDLLRRRMLNLTYCQYLVIDEADRLLDMGFIEDIDAIIDFMPKKKQTMMFSATINDRVVHLMDRYMYNPVKILLENILQRGILKQYYYNVRENQKLSLLVHILNTEKRRGLTLVFCNTKRKTKFVASVLKKNGISAECLNGDMTQFMREKAMRDFAMEKIDVLVATDVAARGIHVEDITHVINYDLNDDREIYTHRIGRTARNGKKGTAIILLSERDYRNMYKVMDTYEEMMEKREVPQLEKIRMPPRKPMHRGRKPVHRGYSRHGFRRNYRR